MKCERVRLPSLNQCCVAFFAADGGKLILLVRILLGREWVLQTVEKVDTAGNCNKHVNSPCDCKSLGVLEVLRVIKVTNVALATLPEQKCESSEEKECPNTNDKPTRSTSDAAAASHNARNTLTPGHNFVDDKSG